MIIDKIGFKSSQPQTIQTQQKNTNGVLEKFYTNVQNSADMTDTLIVPRTIFKGYLGIMSGTTLVTIGSLLNKYKKISKPLTIAGLLSSLYGTWAFVRPYIIKDAKGVATPNITTQKESQN